jgi:hypothetical protein
MPSNACHLGQELFSSLRVEAIPGSLYYTEGHNPVTVVTWL